MIRSKNITANIITIGLFLSLAIFITDLQTPLGIADGVLYIIVLFPFIWASDRRFIAMAAALVLALIIAGYFLSPPAPSNPGAYIAITNRLFSIIIVMVSAVMILRYKKSELFHQGNLKELSDYKYALGESTIIAVTDQKGIIKRVNESFCKISQYSEEELIGHDHRMINSGYHSKEFIHNLWMTIASGKTWKGELKNKAKDGTFYWVDTSIVPFLNEQDKPYQYLSIRADITKRKEAEEQLIQRSAQLETANKELVFQNSEIEKKATELIISHKNLLAFTYVSSHDLQEPLRKIQTFVSIILENESKNLSEDGKYNFQRLQSVTGRMQQLIEDLLDFSRIATIELKFEKTDLRAILDEVKAELKNIIQEKHTTIETNDLCFANIIPSQFRMLLNNLISNSIKFSQPGIPSHITIKSGIVKGSQLNNEMPSLPAGSLSPDKNYCHITFKDNGIGFEPHFSERIFGVFQKLHGKDEYAGTGIGLAIVKKIVENHHGIITATSELNKGATFDIYLPAGQADFSGN